MDILLKPVAVVANDRKGLDDDFWGPVLSKITLLPEFPVNAFDGIDTFSHLEIIFFFDQADPLKALTHGHPRGNKDWPAVGIFAQRKSNRPNSIGLTIVELVRREGNSIWVKNLDAVDGTPVLDIKPVMKEFLPLGEIKQPQWSHELMNNYWK